jgi:Domain of unknown function (4846)
MARLRHGTTSAAIGLLTAVIAPACAPRPEPAPAVTVEAARPPPEPAQASPGTRPEPPRPPPAARAAVPPPAPSPAASYPWLDDPVAAVPPPSGALEDRFAPPPGFERVELAAGSFGAWLRRLPLAPPGTSVVSYRGDVILPAGHENLAAVVDLDVGAADLQQCADSILRLHAEWLWSRGRRDVSYRAASGAPIPWARWSRGERVVAQGMAFGWKLSGRPDESHAGFRRYLDAVFTYANTGSIARDGRPVAEADLAPGDFVVQAGAPGHAVLILDLARAPDGRRALLLGQGYMPAQSFQVLAPSRRGPWFVVEPGDEALATPFWTPFAWGRLRRLDEPAR